eukprot:symbB.v1.2.041112.t1/scaffold7815.1/size9168/1
MASLHVFAGSTKRLMRSAWLDEEVYARP